MSEPVDPQFENRAIADAAWLIGEWRIELTNAEWLDDGATLVGAMTGSWLAGAAFIVLRTVFESGPPPSVQVIGRNENVEQFETLYADDRGVSRVYATTFGTNEWTLERFDSDFSQRFEGVVDDERQHVRASWLISADGHAWDHDFDLHYSRV